MLRKIFSESDGQLNVSFDLQCNDMQGNAYGDFESKNSLFCLSAAALSANATLANTNICNGLIGTGILPGLDSPKTFQRLSSSPSLSSLEILSSSVQSNLSTVSGCISSQSDSFDSESNMLKSMSAPGRSEGFLNALEVQMAGGAAGEDRVQAVFSEENGWLFCGIYDGFNGRDAADFLAGTLYENIRLYLNMMDSELTNNNSTNLDDSECDFQYLIEDDNSIYCQEVTQLFKDEVQCDLFEHDILCCLEQALAQAENDFLCMVEREMNDRPDLVSIGSCVLVVLLYGLNLYTISLGDSRAILAKSKDCSINNYEDLEAVQLTDCHSVDNEIEQMRILSEHPDDLMTITGGRVKGKLKLTRAFGVGYMKNKKMNDALMGILQVPNLLSPPYISTQPSLNAHHISEGDQFVIIASDGLFDFFSNKEAVMLMHSYLNNSPSGNPAEFLVEQLIHRAAKIAGLSLEELMSTPTGRRRKYHDDVTVIVVLLGSDHRTSAASTHQ